MNTHYKQIEKAISYLNKNVEEQPSLEDISKHLGLSKAHFQRLFSSWAGISPKRYLQILSLEHAKKLLKQSQPQLEVSLNLGLSSTSRLYEHFIHLEAVTPDEYKKEGFGLEISYALVVTPFGETFIATTSRGICKLSFIPKEQYQEEIRNLKKVWSKAIFREEIKQIQELSTTIFSRKATDNKPLSLLVRGTNFQVNVWKALLNIPNASLCSYGDIAKSIHKPQAHRAVATAIGMNPIAFIIPCHRVIQKSGKVGGYHWGEECKHAIHAWEMADQE